MGVGTEVDLRAEQRALTNTEYNALRQLGVVFPADPTANRRQVAQAAQAAARWRGRLLELEQFHRDHPHVPLTRAALRRAGNTVSHCEESGFKVCFIEKLTIHLSAI